MRAYRTTTVQTSRKVSNNREKKTPLATHWRRFRGCALILALIGLIAAHQAIDANASFSGTMTSVAQWPANDHEPSVAHRADWLDDIIDLLDDIIEAAGRDEKVDDGAGGDDEDQP